MGGQVVTVLTCGVVMEDWISLRAYARHRGVALSAVQKAIEAGRVTAVKRKPNGRLHKIEKLGADLQWAANTDPVEAARNGKFAGPGGDLLASESSNAPTAPADSGATTAPPASSTSAAAREDQAEYLAARAKREGYMAETARLDHLERLGLLVSTAAVEQEMVEIFGQIKAGVLRIADRKAQILAAESDPARVHRILMDEFRTTFDECSRRFAAIAAGGSEEPAPALH